jgi:hypothetical protein
VAFFSPLVWVETHLREAKFLTMIPSATAFRSLLGRGGQSNFRMPPCYRIASRRFRSRRGMIIDYWLHIGMGQ